MFAFKVYVPILLRPFDEFHLCEVHLSRYRSKDLDIGHPHPKRDLEINVIDLKFLLYIIETIC